MTDTPRVRRGRRAHALGVAAEAAASAALERDGWNVRARRLRTEAGEVDLIAEQDGLLAIIEVKARPTLAGAAFALTERQRRRCLRQRRSCWQDIPSGVRKACGSICCWWMRLARSDALPMHSA
jgi:putative endonuclease